MELRNKILELIRRTTSTLPADVLDVLNAASREGAAGSVIAAIKENAKLAAANITPLCQDTGTLTFWIDCPPKSDEPAIENAVREAVAEATAQGLLRQNTINTANGHSYSDNLAFDSPQIHFTQVVGAKEITISLLQKGGGCENVSCQYSLPNVELGVSRDFAGVRACVLDGICKAQGNGCAPGIVGVCIGGDRAAAYLTAKKQLLRPLTTRNENPDLARLEEEILRDANTLGIGPMGLGGSPTLLGVHIAAASRLPASYFVTIAYSCWACRRGSITV